MPACYAHHRFGEQLLPQLPEDVGKTVRRFRGLFDMGLQGPDFLFYFNPYMENSLKTLGSAFHRQTGQQFFTRACAQASSEGARAYLYGLLAHYCLDSACHPFVEEMVRQGLARHVPLESEFDRYLMERDGIPEPHSRDLSSCLHLTRGECATVADFYPGVTPANVRWSVWHMGWSLRFLTGEKRRNLLQKISPRLLEHAIPGEPVAEYARMDSELLARFNRSLRSYPAMLQQLQAHMQTGEALGEAFEATFN